VARPRTITGIDPDIPSLRGNSQIRRLVAGNAVQLPFRSESFDLVTANMVFEHLSDPGACLLEVIRVLRPGGRLVFHTPNSRHYLFRIAAMISQGLKERIIQVAEARQEADVFPTLYRINRTSTISEMAASTGYELARIGCSEFIEPRKYRYGALRRNRFALATNHWRRTAPRPPQPPHNRFGQTGPRTAAERRCRIVIVQARSFLANYPEVCGCRRRRGCSTSHSNRETGGIGNPTRVVHIHVSRLPC
jgi:SAM-dependent methyltransferase